MTTPSNTPSSEPVDTIEEVYKLLTTDDRQEAIQKMKDLSPEALEIVIHKLSNDDIHAIIYAQLEASKGGEKEPTPEAIEDIKFLIKEKATNATTTKETK